MPNSCQVQEDSTCLQVLIKSAFNVAGQGSNLVASASFFLETSLVLTKNAFDCQRNALQGQMLEELVAETNEGDWATGYKVQILSRLINGNYFCFPPDLWDEICHQVSGEEFRQPRESTSTQVLQEFNVNLIIAWGSCRFCQCPICKKTVGCRWLASTKGATIEAPHGLESTAPGYNQIHMMLRFAGDSLSTLSCNMRRAGPWSAKLEGCFLDLWLGSLWIRSQVASFVSLTERYSPYSIIIYIIILLCQERRDLPDQQNQNLTKLKAGAIVLQIQILIYTISPSLACCTNNVYRKQNRKL